VTSRALVTAAALLALASDPSAALRVEVLRSIGGLPPHIVGRFEEPVNFQQAANGVYYVFDRRGHAVHSIDPDRRGSAKIVDIGPEPGRILQPTGFDVAPDGRFVVADNPARRPRIQTFSATGERGVGFFLPGAPAASVVFNGFVLDGIASIQYTGESLLISHPESGGLFTEYSLTGYARRTIGRLRQTGFESDRQLNVAMNAGIPLVDPTGGFYYVFITGRPMLRKYDTKGELLFERVVQGREMDELLDKQPNRWPTRRVEDRELPIVAPVVRAAAVSPRGELWLSLAAPFTYVYDQTGDKIRTVQFRAAGIMSPASMFFNRQGHLLVTPGCYEFDPEQQ
jgi:hypothetical protein